MADSMNAHVTSNYAWLNAPAVSPAQRLCTSNVSTDVRRHNAHVGCNAFLLQLFVTSFGVRM